MALALPSRAERIRPRLDELLAARDAATIRLV
jgi:hypothetical protein